MSSRAPAPFFLLPPSNSLTRSTLQAEKRFDEVLTRREKEEIEKAAGKTHRDKVKEFNEKLANESEHYDIPKVGPG